jgi:hypothetical protein
VTKWRTWRRWIGRGLIAVCVLAAFVVLAVQFLQGSVLRGFTNGELEGAATGARSRSFSLAGTDSTTSLAFPR